MRNAGNALWQFRRFLYESLQTHFLRAEALRKSAMAKQ